jgi:hypothetical protein
MIISHKPWPWDVKRETHIYIYIYIHTTQRYIGVEFLPPSFFDKRKPVNCTTKSQKVFSFFSLKMQFFPSSTDSEEIVIVIVKILIK